MVRVDLSWRSFVVVLALISFVFVSAAVWPYIGNPGGQYHGAHEVWIDTSSGEMNLQAAYDAGLLGSGGSAGVLDLVNGMHSSGQCTGLSGTVVSDGSDDYCRFDVTDAWDATCPSGWAQYEDYSATSSIYLRAYASRICQTSESHSYDTARCYGWRCSTGSHSFSDQAAESCTPSFCYLGSNSGSISGWDATCKSWATSDSTSCDSKPNAYICTSSEWISDPVPWSKSIDSSMSGGASNAIITELGCY